MSTVFERVQNNPGVTTFNYAVCSFRYLVIELSVHVHKPSIGRVRFAFYRRGNDRYTVSSFSLWDLRGRPTTSSSWGLRGRPTVKPLGLASAASRIKPLRPMSPARFARPGLHRSVAQYQRTNMQQVCTHIRQPRPAVVPRSRQTLSTMQTYHRSSNRGNTTSCCCTQTRPERMR